jgi:hypothetical protein
VTQNSRPVKARSSAVSKQVIQVRAKENCRKATHKPWHTVRSDVTYVVYCQHRAQSHEQEQQIFNSNITPPPHNITAVAPEGPVTSGFHWHSTMIQYLGRAASAMLPMGVSQDLPPIRSTCTSYGAHHRTHRNKESNCIAMFSRSESTETEHARTTDTYSVRDRCIY